MESERQKTSRVVVAGLCVLLCSAPLLAVFFNDGGVHDVDYVIPNTDSFGLAVDFGTTVNVLPGAWVQGGYYNGDVSALGTINFYGGIVDGTVYVYDTGTVTVYGSGFTIDDGSGPVALDPSVTQINNPYAPNWTIYQFTLTGQYDNGDPINLFISLDYPTSVLYLNWPAPEPNINVYPISHEIDFGDIEVGQSSSGIVQIYNNGNADLQVAPAQIVGDAAFLITVDPTPMAVAPGLTVDIEVTFTPADEGYVTASLIINSDDPDQPSIDVFLGGAGVITEVPPSEQIQEIIAFYNQSIAEGTIVGYGPWNLPERRVKALRCMLVAAGHLINGGYYRLATITLEAVDKLSDGKKCPQDFIVGENVAPFNTMVNTLIEDLENL